MAKAVLRDTDRGLKAMLERIARGGAELTVGVHEVDGAEEKAGDEHVGTPLIVVAAAHEFGTDTIPERSFIRKWQDENEAEHKQNLSDMAKAVVKGEVPSGAIALQRLGAKFVGDVQKRIADGITPGLEQATIDRKGSSKPLIDTGQLRSAIAYAVNHKLTRSPKQIGPSGASKKKKPKKKAAAVAKKSRTKNRKKK